MADDPNSNAESRADASGSGGGIDLGFLIGVPLAFLMIVAGLFLEGASLGAYVGSAAACFVFGGTVGVTLAALGVNKLKSIPALILRAIKFTPADRTHSIKTLVSFAEKARREGLLVLEDDLRNTGDDFLRHGMQLVVDGTDPELVKEILRTEADSLHEELHSDANMFEFMAGLSPTMGIVGTVIGLVVTLSNMSDADSLAASIAVAFVATLYGVGAANLIWLPIAVKLQNAANSEVALKEMMIEGILAIQSGDNPRIVEEKLVAFLNTKDRAAYRASDEQEASDEMGVAA